MTKRDTLLPHSWGTVTADTISDRAAFGQGFFTDSIDISPAHRQFFRMLVLNTLFATRQPRLVCKAMFAQHGLKIEHNPSSPLRNMAVQLDKAFNYLGLRISRPVSQEKQCITLTKDLPFRLVHLELLHSQFIGNGNINYKVSMLSDDTTEIKTYHCTLEQLVEMMKDFREESVFFFQNHELVGYYDSEVEELLPGLLGESLSGNKAVNQLFEKHGIAVPKGPTPGEAKRHEAKLLHVECAQNVITCLMEYGQNETSTPLLEWVYAELKAGRLTAKEIGLGDKSLISDKGRWFVGKEV